MLGMSIETVVITMIVIVTVSAIFAPARVMAQKRRSDRRNAAGKEFALLADARAVEHLARTLLANRREDLDFSDALGPSKQ